VVVEDQLPTEQVDFIIGSITSSPPMTQILYNNGAYTPTGSNGEPDPAVESWQVFWDVVGIGQTITITFTAQVEPDLMGQAVVISNSATIQAQNLPGSVASSDLEYPGDPGTLTCVNMTPTATPPVTETPIVTGTPTATETGIPTTPTTTTPIPSLTPNLTETPVGEVTLTPSLEPPPENTPKPPTATPNQPPSQPVPGPTPTFAATPTPTPPFPVRLPETGYRQPRDGMVFGLIWVGLLVLVVLVSRRFLP
jgi:hypothetical protein